MSRTVTVFGATGQQGSSVANALLADGTFTVRAVTRKASSEAALKLKERGVEVVQADLDDGPSLKAALVGSEGVFGVTNAADPALLAKGQDTEFAQGKLLVDIAKEVGVKFFVWSSLPNITELSNGKYSDVSGFDNKAHVTDYLRESGLPHANVYTGYFAENVKNFGALKESSPGSFQLAIPRASPKPEFPITWVEQDLGASVLALFKNYVARKDEVVNKSFVVATARMTLPQFAELISSGIGKPVEYVSPPTYGIAQLDSMYDHMNEFGLYSDTVVPDRRLLALGVKFGDLKDFVEIKVKPLIS